MPSKLAIGSAQPEDSRQMKIYTLVTRTRADSIVSVMH
jgi:hypothetical protein